MTVSLPLFLAAIAGSIWPVEVSKKKAQKQNEKTCAIVEEVTFLME